MRYTTALCICFLISAAPAFAQTTQRRSEPIQVSGMQEDMDGVLERNEFIVISPNGSVTRAWCPHTCRQRDIPAKHCREWPSKMDPKLCYVQDLRIPSQAVPVK